MSVQLDARLLNILGEETVRQNVKTVIPESRWTPTRLAINLLLHKPQLANDTGSQNHLTEANIPGTELLLQLLDTIHEEPQISTQNLLDRFNDSEQKSHLYQLAAVQPAMENEESIDLMFKDCLQQLQKQYIDIRQKQLIVKLQSGEPLSETEKLEHKQLFTKR